jgi:hypothetical protein
MMVKRAEMIEAIADDLLLMRNPPLLVGNLKRAALKLRPGDVCIDTVRNIQDTVEDSVSESLIVGVRADFGQYGCDPRKLIPTATPAPLR